MTSPWPILLAATVLAGAPLHVLAQETTAIACKERPCAVVVDWTRSGGVTSLTPDRRYGSPAQFEDVMKSVLTSRGYAMHGSTDAADLRILLQPVMQNAMCDQIPGTNPDMSCRAIMRVETRLEGPDITTKGIDLPGQIRNRCGSDQVMDTEKMANFVAEWIMYAVEGKAKGERRPVGRC